MQREQNSELTIDLLELGKSLLKHKWIILQAALLGLVLALLLALFFIPPEYEANASFYVNNSASQNIRAESINSADITASKTLISTYGVILKSRMVLTEIIDKAGVDYSVDQLKKMITTNAVNDTEVMSVVVKSTSPTEAERIANTIMEILPEKISSVVNGSSVKVVDYAVVPTGKTSPSVKKYMLVGTLLGFIISCVVLCAIDVFDDVIKNTSYLKQNFDLPILAVIPDMQKDTKNGQKHQEYSRSRKVSA